MLNTQGFPPDPTKASGFFGLPECRKGPSGKETRKSTLGVLNLVIKFPPTPMTGDGATCAPSPQAQASLFSARRLMPPSQTSSA